MKIKRPGIQSSMNQRESRYNRNKQQMPNNKSKMQLNRQRRNNIHINALQSNQKRVATVMILDNILHLIKNSLDLTSFEFIFSLIRATVNF